MNFLILMNNVFNNFFNDVVRNVDPTLKGIIAFACFGFALFLFAKSFKVKDKGSAPFKFGHIAIAVLLLGIGALYTFF